MKISKGLLASSLLISASWASSVLDLSPVLKENPVLDAKRKALGYSGRALVDKGSFVYDNPAALSLTEKTAFSATVEGQSTKADVDDLVHSDQSFALPIFSLSLPFMGNGGLGFAYVQSRSNELRLADENSKTIYQQIGGTTEIVAAASWSIAKTWSLGTSFNFLSGIDKREFNIPISDLTGSLEDVSKIMIAKTQEEILSDGLKLNFAFHWEERLWGAYLGFEPGYTLNQDISSRQLLSYDSEWAIGIKDRQEYTIYKVKNPNRSLEQKIPARFKMGARYNLDLFNLFVLDASFADASSDEYKVKTWSTWLEPNSVNRTEFTFGVGYQLGGSTRPFDSFFQMSSFRLGYDYLMAAQVDIEQYRFSTGFGFPLGKRGATIDLELEYGLRENTKNWQEEFIGFSVSLTGLGNWGEPSRRYR